MEQFLSAALRELCPRAPLSLSRRPCRVRVIRPEPALAPCVSQGWSAAAQQGAVLAHWSACGPFACLPPSSPQNSRALGKPLCSLPIAPDVPPGPHALLFYLRQRHAANLRCPGFLVHLRASARMLAGAFDRVQSALSGLSFPGLSFLCRFRLSRFRSSASGQVASGQVASGQGASGLALPGNWRSGPWVSASGPKPSGSPGCGCCLREGRASAAPLPLG
jgi:hypothetical protein